MPEKDTEPTRKRHSGAVTDRIVEFAKPHVTETLSQQLSSSPPLTGILTFSLKGHQSFHAFTSAFNVRRKRWARRMERSEGGGGGGERLDLDMGRRWGSTLRGTRSKRGKRPKQSVLRPRSEPWGTHPLLLISYRYRLLSATWYLYFTNFTAWLVRCDIYIFWYKEFDPQVYLMSGLKAYWEYN